MIRSEIWWTPHSLRSKTILSQSDCVSGETSCRETTRLFIVPAKPFRKSGKNAEHAAGDRKPIAIATIGRKLVCSRDLQSSNQDVGFRCRLGIPNRSPGTGH